MDKEWYKSMTYWGALGFAIVTVLQQFGMQYPTLIPIAQTITGLMTALGLRRAI